MKLRLPVILLLMVLAACSTSPENRYYTLVPVLPAATQSTPGLKLTGDSWSLSTVTIPAVLDRPQIILRSGTNSVNILEYDRWAEPMDSMVTRILSQDLAARMNTSAPQPATPEVPRQISVAINEFDADDAGHVTLKATWTLQMADVTSHYEFERTEPASGQGISAMVSTMSNLLGELANTIAGQR